LNFFKALIACSEDVRSRNREHPLQYGCQIRD